KIRLKTDPSRALRDRINETSLLDRCVDDIKRLLLPAAEVRALPADHQDVVTLQSDGGHEVDAGRNYGDGDGEYDEDEAMPW
ncbi:hypothetical protein HW130_33775, partial [Streptomyces sp. PKU-EA00015]|nr:hypothetical protein [Streptomyces sp. PKU-EA00015]